MGLYAGVDGCKAGWVVVVFDEQFAFGSGSGTVAHEFSQVLAMTKACNVVVVDMPIGVPQIADEGGREADRVARRMLKPCTSRVFPTPPRAVLDANTYEEARNLAKSHTSHGKGLSRQAFGIVPKILEVDDLMSPKLQDRVLEGHPELSFAAMNGHHVVEDSKRSLKGRVLRQQLLEQNGLGRGAAQLVEAVPRGVGIDDVLDAAALAWTARRVGRGEAVRIPEVPPTDNRGLRMEMWY